MRSLEERKENSGVDNARVRDVVKSDSDKDS